MNSRRRLTYLAQLREAFVIGYGLWGSFGIALGAISIFNLIAKALQLGLAPVVKDLVNAYVWTFHSVPLDPIWRLLQYHPPAWLNDTIVLWSAAAAIACRTLQAMRNHVLHHNDVNVELGSVERYLFGLSTWRFNMLAFAVSMLAWPLLWVRYIYSKKLTFKFLKLFDSRQTVEATILRLNVSYRSVWTVQVLSILTLVALLLITSAGLPGTS